MPDADLLTLAKSLATPRQTGPCRRVKSQHDTSGQSVAVQCSFGVRRSRGRGFFAAEAPRCMRVNEKRGEWRSPPLTGLRMNFPVARELQREFRRNAADPEC